MVDLILKANGQQVVDALRIVAIENELVNNREKYNPTIDELAILKEAARIRLDYYNRDYQFFDKKVIDDPVYNLAVRL